MTYLDNIVLGRDGFVFDSHTGNTYHVNEIGRTIISLMQSGKVMDEIAQVISETYSNNFDETLIDVMEFQNHLTIIGLLK